MTEEIQSLRQRVLQAAAASDEPMVHEKAPTISKPMADAEKLECEARKLETEQLKQEPRSIASRVPHALKTLKSVSPAFFIHRDFQTP